MPVVAAPAQEPASDDTADVEIVQPNMATAVDKLANDLAGGLASYPSIIPRRQCQSARGEARDELVATVPHTTAFIHRSVLVDWMDAYLPHDTQLAVLGTIYLLEVRAQL